MGLDAHARIHREAAVLIAQHLFGLKTLQQAPAHEGTQDAAAQRGLCLGHGIRVDVACRVKDDARRGGFAIDSTGGNPISRHFLEHPIDHTDVKMHMRGQAGAESVDEGHCADV